VDYRYGSNNHASSGFDYLLPRMKFCISSANGAIVVGIHGLEDANSASLIILVPSSLPNVAVGKHNYCEGAKHK